MAAENTRCTMLLSEEKQSGSASEMTSWDRQILILASDHVRAGRVATALGDQRHQTEITGHADWQVRRLKLIGASAIILASPEVDLDLLEELLAVRRFRSVPILVFVDQGSREEMSHALRLGVSAFIVDGLEPERIPAILHVAEERHSLTLALRDELQKSREDLAARKTIERAKGLLMTKSGLSEHEVYNSMRRMAMTQGKPMREIADNVLAIFTIFP